MLRRLLPKALKGQSLKSHALKGGVVALSGFGAVQGIRLISNLVMTRLLAPDAFGLVGVTSALQTLALIALGRLAFGASLPQSWLGLIGAVIRGALCFAGLGVGAAALIRSAEGVSAVVNVIVLPMAFLSGSFGSTDDFPAFLQAIADVLPLTYFLDVVNGVYLDGESLFADPKALAIVAAWGTAGLLVALWRFGWMPRER